MQFFVLDTAQYFFYEEFPVVVQPRGCDKSFNIMHLAKLQKEIFYVMLFDI
jgi:hypothetical protein